MLPKFSLYIMGFLCLISSLPAVQTTQKYVPAAKFRLSDAEKNAVRDIVEEMKREETGTFAVADILEEGYVGNPVALYVAGQCFIMGTGTPVNKEAALHHFVMSASLGFTPALYEIYEAYASELKNPHLALVYLNLVISLGHREFKTLYDQEIERIIKQNGRRMAREIERLALIKLERISHLQKEMVVTEKDPKPALKLLNRNIASEDKQYSLSYFQSFQQ